MLKATVTTLDDVEEAFRTLYKKSIDGEGKDVFVLQVDGLNDHPETRGLKSALEAQKTQTREAKDKATALAARVEGLPDDFNADAYSALKLAAEKGGKGAPDPAEIEKLVNERVSKVQRESDEKLAVANGNTDKIRTRLFNSERDRVLNEALASAGVSDPAYLRASAAMLRDKLSVVEDGEGNLSVLAMGEYDVQVPAGGFIKQWADTDEGKAFVGAPQSRGGGSDDKGGRPGNKTLKRSEFDGLSAAQRSDKIRDGFTVVDG